MTVLAEFDGFTLRAADTLADVEVLSDWIEQDEAHRDIYAPGHFLNGTFGEDSRPTCYALEDEDGTVFYIRLSRAVRVEIQFPPEDDLSQRSRILRGLVHGMAFLEVELARVGCEQWIFDTENPRLKKAAERLLGFTESTHEMVRPITAPGKQREVEVQ